MSLVRQIKRDKIAEKYFIEYIKWSEILWNHSEMIEKKELKNEKVDDADLKKGTEIALRYDLVSELLMKYLSNTFGLDIGFLKNPTIKDHDHPTNKIIIEVGEFVKDKYGIDYIMGLKTSESNF